MLQLLVSSCQLVESGKSVLELQSSAVAKRLLSADREIECALLRHLLSGCYMTIHPHLIQRQVAKEDKLHEQHIYEA